MSHYVVIGAGQAGAALVAKLRAAGFDGQITLIGAEPALPYQRPPLSKKYLLGEMVLDRLFLRPAQFYADQEIDVLTGAYVTSLNLDAKTLTLAAGDVIAWDKLAIATGASPVRLPAALGGDLAGVHTMRSLADADAMADEVQPDRSVLIVGGGYIGLEAAAVAAAKGLRVTLVELGDRILNRVACAETASYFKALHTKHDVDIREGTGLSRLVGTDGRVTAADLSDGTCLPVDFVVTGIGVRPDTQLAEAAGLTIDNGIAVDARGATSHPDIFAAGDVASFPYHGTRIRLESVPNAIDQAEVTALNMMGQDVDYVSKPWFWSDQFDVKLQIAGLNTGFDRVVVRQTGAAQSHWYYKGASLLAVDALNALRDYMVGKRLIDGGLHPDPALLSDPETDLKSRIIAAKAA